MTSPFAAALDMISDDWEAHAPPDRTTVTYHEVEGKRFLDGTSGDRSFHFEGIIRQSPVGQAGPAQSLVDWTVAIKLRLSQGPRSQKALRSAIINEGNLLSRLIELRSTWPSGVKDVETHEVTSEREGEKGDAILTLNLTARTEETDS